MTTETVFIAQVDGKWLMDVGDLYEFKRVTQLWEQFYFKTQDEAKEVATNYAFEHDLGKVTIYSLEASMQWVDGVYRLHPIEGTLEELEEIDMKHERKVADDELDNMRTKQTEVL